MKTLLRNLRHSIPNFITSLNLLAGCTAIWFSFHIIEQFGSLTGLECCWLAIAAASVFDFCDGATARILKEFSRLGKDLDSLADLVSFGVAPALMMLNLMLVHSTTPWLCFAALLLAPAGAMRLAIFNNDTAQHISFRGLPIPANAIFWIGFTAWVVRYGFPGTIVCVLLVLALSAAMVGRFPMFSLKFKNMSLRDNFSRYAIVLAAILFLICYGVSGLMWTIVLYLAISLLRRRSILEEESRA